MKYSFYIALFSFLLLASENLFASNQTISDSTKRDLWLTFNGIYVPHEFGGFLSFGVILDQTTKRKKITNSYYFYNTYLNYFKGKYPTARRYTMLTCGKNYNFFKKNKLNVGLQTGLFLYDGYYGTAGIGHSFGATTVAVIDYQYCFKKFSFGLDFLYSLNFGKFSIPQSAIFNPTLDDITYKVKYGYNISAFYNLKISIKL